MGALGAAALGALDVFVDFLAGAILTPAVPDVGTDAPTFRLTSFSFPATSPTLERATTLAEDGLWLEVALLRLSPLSPLPLDDVLSFDERGRFSPNTVFFVFVFSFTVCRLAGALTVFTVLATLLAPAITPLLVLACTRPVMAVPSWKPPGIFSKPKPDSLLSGLGRDSKPCASEPVPRRPGKEEMASVGAIAGDKPMWRIRERGDREPGPGSTSI